MTERECEVCGRAEGSTLGRCGVNDGIPPGPVERCVTCGRFACPDCLHEADCCFVEADDRENVPTWAPPGWRRLPPSEGGCQRYERL